MAADAPEAYVLYRELDFLRAACRDGEPRAFDLELIKRMLLVGKLRRDLDAPGEA